MALATQLENQPQGAMAPPPPPPEQKGAMAPPPVPGQPPQQPQSTYQPPAVGGDQWGGYQNAFGGIQATPNQYEADVLDGKYLDLENNPYAQQYSDAIRNDLNEEFERSSGQAMGQFAGAGGTMGFSGMSVGLQQRLADQHGENVANEVAEVYSGIYQSERALQNQMDAILSQRTETMYGVAGQAYASDRQKEATLGAAQIGADAQMYGADRSKEAILGSARIGADAQMYASDQQANAVISSARQNANASRYSSRLAYNLGEDQLAADLWYKAESLEQNAYLLQNTISGGYLGDLAGMSGGKTSQGISAGASAGQGAIGGGLLAAGMPFQPQGAAAAAPGATNTAGQTVQVTPTGPTAGYW